MRTCLDEEDSVTWWKIACACLEILIKVMCINHHGFTKTQLKVIFKHN